MVEIGNWGRICRLEVIQQNTRLLKEMIFENVRMKCYPDRPSRFACNFVCPNLQSALNFVRVTGRRYDILYEVELVDPNAAKFETDWSLLPPDQVTMAQAEEAAHKYWNPQGVRDDVKEVLVLSDIRITEKYP